MSPLPPSGRDVRAVVRAADALTTQVRRIADALTTGVVTTQTTTCDASTLGVGNRHLGPCVLRDGHDGPVHRGPEGETWATVVAEAQQPKLPPMDPVHILGIDPSTPDGVAVQQAPAADEDAQRTARRVSLRVLINRANNGIKLTTDEAQLLARHVATEICNANTADEQRRRADQLEELLSIAYETSNRSEAERARAVDQAGRAEAALAEARADYERMRDLLRAENTRANDAIDREHTAEQAAEEAQRERDQQAAVLAEVLRHFKPALVNGQYAFYQATDQPIALEDYQRWSSVVRHDVERPWWQQLDTMRAELAEAQAAIERVRALADRWDRDAPPPGNRPLTDLRAALDGTEQPTTEQQPLRVTPCNPPCMAVHCGGECLPILDSDPDRDRIDRIALVGDTLKVYTGAPGGPPPSCGTGAHLIAEVEVPRGTTAITAAHITSSGLIFYRPTTKE